ncbi:hypothetical protein fugu_002931 [Takifugu bimaculatus]|uniref:Metalloendopeptidase n=1 Tax=Takifugu bimaculatus TaxID=433685 RepID=A0A4Z2BFG1_9TELE|nr:hypothetical protein fugu_002931 [Takifugu bimaculatus]
MQFGLSYANLKMTTIMTPIVLFLLFLSLTAIPPGGRQYISLQRPGCVRSGVVHHEILHALGFHHEQSRSDRDRFVTINYANIQPGRQRNFRKVQTNNLGTSYNYRSVMHYRKTSFSRNGLPTIVAKGNPNQILGSSFITYSDIIRVRRLYGCRVVHHEILHALGFHHEQSHSDRDKYVTINHTNIQPGKEKNFRKVQTNNSYTDYYYRSVMHYGE